MKTTSVNIKEVPISDLGQLNSLDIAAFPHERHQLKDEFDLKYARIYGAYVGPRLIGFVNIRIIVDHVEVMVVCVDPPFQRAGVASQLMQHLFAALPNVSRFFLEVRESNVPAISFYEKWGFKMTATRKRYYHDGEAARVMIKQSKPSGSP